MRRIVAFDNVTADGYFSAPEGGLEWVVQEPEIHQRAAGNMQGIGTILFGRRTYEMFESFWPHALDGSGSAPNPHDAGRRSPEMRAMAVWINDARKLVFSTTRKQVTWKNSRILREIDTGEIEALRRESGTDIMLFGSGSIASQLTRAGLIDEYQFVVNPVFLGAGKPLISGLPKVSKLQLLEAKAFASGNVMLRYARSG